MRSIGPINFSHIIPLGKFMNKQSQSLPAFSANQQVNYLSDVQNASSRINSRTPVGYSKIAEIPVSGLENKVQIYKLSNGQKVVLLKKEGPTIVQTTFKVGGFNEPDNLRGISHYIEHNLFNGSERLKPREYNERLARIGAYTNAFTTNNATSYYAKSALGNETLEELIKLNAEQVQFPTFPVEQLEKEKDIVCTEINMFDDMPSVVALGRMEKELFQIQSTSNDLVTGDIKNIKALTRDDVVNYYNKFYTPENATTIIIGDINPEETIQLVSKYYTKQNYSKPLEKTHEDLKPISSPARVDLISDNAIGTEIAVGFAGPENTNLKERLALSLATALLDGSKKAKLTKALSDLKVGGQFSMFEVGNRKNDNTCCSYTINVPDELSEKVLSTIYREIANFTQNPQAQEEFETVKRKYLSTISDNNETTDQLANFISEVLFYDDKEALANYREIVESLTYSDVLNAAAKYLDLNKASVCMVHPSSSDEQKIRANYRQNAVSFKGTANTNKDLYSKVREYTLPNNISVAVNPSNSTEKCIFSTKYNYPLFKDATNLELMVLQNILNNGSMYTDEQTQEDNLLKKDIDLEFEVTPTSLSYVARCPQNEMQTTFNTINEIMRYPRITQERLNKSIETVKNSLKGEFQPQLAILLKGLFPGLKIAQTNKEMLESIDNISVQRIQELYSRILQSSCANSTLTAPLDKNHSLENLYAYNLMNSVPPAKPFTVNLDETFTQNDGEKILCHTEDNMQTQVSRGYKFKISGNIEDEAKIGLLNTILGGGMSSRLFLDLREQQKLAYSVGSNYSKLGNTGIILMSSSTTTDNPNNDKSSPENVTKMLNGFDKHIEMLKSQPVSDEEIKQAKLILKNELLGGVETNFAKNKVLSESKDSFYGKSRVKLLLDAIDKVTPKDIQAYAKYVFALSPVTVLIASPNTLKALNLNENIK